MKNGIFFMNGDAGRARVTPTKNILKEKIMSNTIEIKKRNSEEVACWKVEVDAVTPNTVIAAETGVTAVLKINGQMRLVLGTTAVVNSLMNPGKGAKLLGGNKPYDKVEIYAIDQTSDFFAEWGLAGNMAIPAYDKENDVHCNVVAFGEYYYRIENFLNFISSFSFNSAGEITRDDVRELLRAETAGVVKSFFTSKLNQFGLRACQSRLGEYAEDIKEAINAKLEKKGLTVYNFVVLKLSYDPKHEAAIKALDDLKLGVKGKKIVNVGNRDDIDVAKAAADIDLAFIKAKGEANRAQVGAPEKPREITASSVVCPRCKERNPEGTNYCSRCGEKLSK